MFNTEVTVKLCNKVEQYTGDDAVMKQKFLRDAVQWYIIQLEMEAACGGNPVWRKVQ